MSRERELLKQVVENFAYVQDMHLIVAIQKLLNQPEQKPLSEDKLVILAEANITDEGIAGYYLGFRDAEKHHGIGGSAQPEQEAVEDRIARWHTLGYEQGKKASQREPLSDEEIDLSTTGMSEFGSDMFKAGIRAAERAHGIGGGE
jgi:hypothetical protein